LATPYFLTSRVVINQNGDNVKGGGILSIDNSNVLYYYSIVIDSFKDKETEKIWNGEYSKRFPVEIQRIARRKLVHIHSAINLNDLRVPPGNRLHPLENTRKGQYSIRINERWRICFRWAGRNAHDVEVVDYH
jgi:proteic killer suppression protein